MSIEKITKDHNLSQSENIVETNIDKLKALFPEIVTEGKIDFKVLQEVLGEELEEGEEYYRFTWAGKANARREAQKPSTGTLRPAPEESVDWDNTQNLYIEGDNLEVLKLMQKSYAGKVKMIYIDPPYNTGKDFVYKDNYKDNLRNYQEVTGQLDDEGNKISTNSDSDGRYHSNWLNMMYPRLRLARNLLSDDGVIFMSIDDHEIENLKKISDDIFGEDNRLANLIWDTNHSAQAGVFKVYHQYILVYAKEVKNISTPKSLNNDLFVAGAMKKESSRHPKSKFSFPKGTKFEAEDGKELKGLWGDAEKVRLCEGRMISENGKLKEDIILEASWTQANQMNDFFYGDKENLLDSRGQKVVDFYFNSSGKIKIVKERSVETPQTTQKFGTQGSISKKLAELFNSDESPFDSPKPIDMIKTFSAWFTEENDIVLDFFGGSSTSAHGVYAANALQQINRNFILIQLPEKINDNLEAIKLGFEKITDLGKERIRRAAKKIAVEHPEKAKNLDLGFKVFKLDTSNIKGWDGNPANLDETLFDAQDNIKTERTENDVLYEILLKYGLELTLPIEEKKIEGKTVFSVGFGALFICLAETITSKVAEGIGAWKEELEPEVCRVVFKDSGFTDVEKTNSVQTLKRFGITEIKSI
jgi:adenine-specific DNA-methyltransferase